MSEYHTTTKYKDSTECPYKEIVEQIREYFKAMQDPAIDEEQYHALELLLGGLLATKEGN